MSNGRSSSGSPIQSYPWYISDWRDSETRLNMTAAERGIYRELLDWHYRDGSLPSDMSTLAKIAGVTLCELRRAWPKITGRFIERDGRLFNERAEKVIDQLEDWHNAKRNAGRNGALKRWNKRSHSGANGTTNSCAIAERWPSTTTSTTTTTSSPTPSSDFDLEPWARSIYEPWPVKGADYPLWLNYLSDWSGIHDAAKRDDYYRKAAAWSAYYSDKYTPKKLTICEWHLSTNWQYWPPGYEPQQPRSVAPQTIRCSLCGDTGRTIDGHPPANGAELLDAVECDCQRGRAA